jgi:hypothetical protein
MNDSIKFIPKGSKTNPLIRKCRPISSTNPSLHIGLPWQVVAMSAIQKDDEFYIYVDFPNTDKIVLERVKKNEGE